MLKTLALYIILGEELDQIEDYYWKNFKKYSRV